MVDNVIIIENAPLRKPDWVMSGKVYIIPYADVDESYVKEVKDAISKVIDYFHLPLKVLPHSEMPEGDYNLLVRI